MIFSKCFESTFKFSRCVDTFCMATVLFRTDRGDIEQSKASALYVLSSLYYHSDNLHLFKLLFPVTLYVGRELVNRSVLSRSVAYGMFFFRSDLKCSHDLKFLRKRWYRAMGKTSFNPFKRDMLDKFLI